uniref:Disease resistance protein At4g11170 family n=1 Tax=Cajanus cajan TaxID=3821 RepID=A0A151T3A6_CAJCA|nr:Putative disease resistance protein At4g11170 family [Cajanus cajan]
MSGSSSSTIVSPPQIRRDVFLSFREEDTHDSFISHLYAELQRKKIDTYIDYKLGRGEEISPALHKAIEDSMIYVLVFSQDYASPTWCLDELINDKTIVLILWMLHGLRSLTMHIGLCSFTFQGDQFLINSLVMARDIQ